MALKNYTTKEKVEKYLNKTITDTLEAYLASAERIIDEYCQRNFKADTTASARYYDGNDSNTLRIDDCVAITKVEIGQDAYGDSFEDVALTDFKLLPNNALLDLRPINEIFSRSHLFSMGIQNQKITAKWGYSVAVPADIELVATVLTAGMYNNYQAGGVAKSESIGSYSVSYDNRQNWDDFNNINSVLNRYKKLSI